MYQDCKLAELLFFCTSEAHSLVWYSYQYCKYVPGSIVSTTSPSRIGRVGSRSRGGRSTCAWMRQILIMFLRTTTNPNSARGGRGLSAATFNSNSRVAVWRDEVWVGYVRFGDQVRVGKREQGVKLCASFSPNPGNIPGNVLSKYITLHREKFTPL